MNVLESLASCFILNQEVLDENFTSLDQIQPEVFERSEVLVFEPGDMVPVTALIPGPGDMVTVTVLVPEPGDMVPVLVPMGELITPWSINRDVIGSTD